MNHAAKSAKSYKPLMVLDFLCDHCGKTIDSIVIATNGTNKRIVKSYHRECWEKYILPTARMEQSN